MSDFRTHNEAIAGGGINWETADSHEAEPSDHQNASYSLASAARGVGEQLQSQHEAQSAQQNENKDVAIKKEIQSKPNVPNKPRVPVGEAPDLNISEVPPLE